MPDVRYDVYLAFEYVGKNKHYFNLQFSQKRVNSLTSNVLK